MMCVGWPPPVCWYKASGSAAVVSGASFVLMAKGRVAPWLWLSPALSLQLTDQRWCDLRSLLVVAGGIDIFGRCGCPLHELHWQLTESWWVLPSHARGCTRCG